MLDSASLTSNLIVVQHFVVQMSQPGVLSIEDDLASPAVLVMSLGDLG